MAMFTFHAHTQTIRSALVALRTTPPPREEKKERKVWPCFVSLLKKKKKKKLETTETMGSTLFSMYALHFHGTSTTNKLKEENSAVPPCNARSLPPQASGVTFLDKQRHWRMLQVCAHNVQCVYARKCVRVCAASAALCNRGRKSQDDGGFQN